MKQTFLGSIFSKKNDLITTNINDYIEFKALSDNPIAIRKACTHDVNQIYNILLSSNDYFMNTQQIEKRLSNLIVLVNGNKLLAVLYFETFGSSSRIIWTAIHPMYPENSISLALRYLICSILTCNH